MVIGTIFGHRRNHVWLCIQHDHLSTKPTLLLELSVSTHQLVNKMQGVELSVSTHHPPP
ncbi:protein MIZU-KUSSEI 1-like [Pyrus ussuriensis x Pyrus communis]|uniref:Protein MIZU-KUSSEI 1-like n=1 Tax=Pyrus ussuriensis x Pyrus communis TaxID=2448454 RepID=A0A5N5FRG8_9ROSA|nr:protein MIZU-KUSSEI 1-like [Pyrus ussuriensis x Pyrus communis]